MAGALVIGGFIAACFIVALAVIGGVALLSKLERFVARKFAEDALSNGPHGDCPAMPDDLKVSHVQLRTGTEA